MLLKHVVNTLGHFGRHASTSTGGPKGRVADDGHEDEVSFIHVGSHTQKNLQGQTNAATHRASSTRLGG